ncbi:MAG TPA: energy transducer TonB [Thiotrichales bacterium]|nr:energy transducer TonB [Thiotrichales bacterium]
MHYYSPADLPWSIDPEERRRFRNILIVVLLAALAGGVVVPMLKVPEVKREQAEQLPPRLAKLIFEKRKPPPPPPPRPEKKEPPKEPKKAEKPKPKPKPEPKKSKPKPKPKVSARQKAEKAGLLAFRDELAELREDPVLAEVVAARPVKSADRDQVKGPAQNTRSLITSQAARGSGGIRTSSVSRNVASSARLAERETTQVESKLATEKEKQAARKREGRKAARSLEELQLVFDRNKGRIYRIYNRALRKDPTLAGKVVLEITIAPTGKVTRCRIVSSELNDKALERKLVVLVKSFDFGARQVETMVATYPLDFLPS